MSDPTCKGCNTSVHLKPSEVERILNEYLAVHPQPRAEPAVVASRLATCRGCDDLQYGTTCRHCGCLVEVLVALRDKACPRPVAAKW